MADLFVKFPGTAGNYISTADVNLLDADTAHIFQSVGAWAAGSGSTALSKVTDESSPFADAALEWLPSVDNNRAIISSANSPVSISAATEYTIIMSLWCEVATDFRIEVVVDTGQVNGPTVTLPADTYVKAAFTLTTAVGATTLAPGVRVGTSDPSNLTTSTKIRAAAVCVREGPDTAFVPSLRIVGDFHLRSKLAAVDWNPADPDSWVGSYRSGGSRYFGMWIQSATGALRFYVSQSSGGEATYDFTGLTLTDGVASEIDVEFSPATKTAVMTVDGVATAPIVQSAATFDVLNENDIHVGDRGPTSGREFPGDIYYVELRDGVDGPVVARFDAQDVP